MSDNEDLNINIGANPAGVESGSKAASAAIKSVQAEANSLDRAFKAMRGSLDPLYAAQVKYNEALANSDRLLAAGRISEQEYAASVNAATEALARQAAAQLKGTSVSNQALNAKRNAAKTLTAAEVAANDVGIAAAKAAATAKAAEEAKLTAQVAVQARQRAAIALQEAKDRFGAAQLAAANIPSVNRNAQGQFVSASAVAAERAAAAEQAAEELRLVQLDSVSANQKARNALRVAATREEAARRAAVAEQAAQAAAVAAAESSTAAAAQAAAAEAELASAKELAAQAAIKSAEEQLAAEAAVQAATEAKAKSAAEAALAEEAAAKATADAAAADAKAALEAKKLEIANRKVAEAEAARVASANRLKASLDPAFAAQQKYNDSIKLASSLFSSGHIDEATKTQAEAAAQKELERALKAGTGAAINNRSAYEGLVMIHEALSRRWSRMAGSAMIEAQSLMGAEKSASLLAMALSPVGLAVIGVTVAIGAAIVATYQWEEAQRKLVVSTVGVGAASGMTAKEIDKLTYSNLNLKSSFKDNQAALEAYAAVGVRSEEAIANLKDTTQDFADLTGQKSKDAVKELATAMKDPSKGAEELNDKLSFLDATQLQEIQTAQDLGDKYKAQAILAKDLKDNDDQAAEAAGGLQSVMHTLGVAFSDAWTILGQLNARMAEFDRFARGAGNAAQDAAAKFQHLLQLKQDSAAGLPLEQATGEGKTEKEQREAAGHVTVLQRALAAEVEQHGANSDAANRARQALSEYSDTLARVNLVDKEYHNELQRSTGLMNLEAQLATAKHAHNKQEVTDLGAKIFALKHYNELASDTDLKAADAAAGGLAGARMRPKGGKGPGVVSEWTERLHDQEIQSKDYFADETDDELKFWQDKLTQTTKYSKEWLEVQAKIYELSKKKARDEYADEIAALKEKIAAVKGNLTEEARLWDEYLQKVKDTFHGVGKEVSDAQKEFNDAQQQMAAERAKLIGEKEKNAESPVDRQYEAAQTNIQSQQESVGFRQSGGAETATAAAQQKRQLVAEEIALEQQHEDTLYEMKQAALQKELAVQNLAPEKITEINQQIESNEAAHQDRMQQLRDKALLDWQKANEEVANASMEKWKASADSITSSLQSTFGSMLTKSITFKQAWKDLVGNLEKTWFDMTIKNLETWILSLVQQNVATRTATVLNTATTAGGQVAQTAAVAAGTSARVGITAAGATAEKSINLLTTLKVIGMHAAKAAAGAYASLAAIPIIGPILGAAAAVATFAAVLAFGALVSAAGGQAQVPYDGQITELHKDEMVLPAKFATPLRKQLMTAGSSDGLFQSTSQQSAEVRNSTVNSTGGDTHFTYAPVVQHHDTSWDQLVKKEGSNMRRWVGNQLRNGAIRTA